ncbi:hypothetical protein HNQ59_001929 [Chitinivorax tropicus]|uniref:Uncharacterized protein n=1 Tax=Chitinivorax tropicus TaxID=714531 RepID=A0A840MJ11_9PROT|nr:hypothetical protein [Chitinivorax tropicus]MBB5018638.1 hypothetical protein [Chitinivorax tropicus]
MQIPPGGCVVHFGEDPAPYRPLVELPANPLLGSKASSYEEAFTNLQRHYAAFESFWTEQVTAEQLDYCAQLALGDSAGDDLALWLPEGFLDSQADKT